jgi:hypothetical protein
MSDKIRPNPSPQTGPNTFRDTSYTQKIYPSRPAEQVLIRPPQVPRTPPKQR